MDKTTLGEQGTNKARLIVFFCIKTMKLVGVDCGARVRVYTHVHTHACTHMQRRTLCLLLEEVRHFYLKILTDTSPNSWSGTFLYAADDKAVARNTPIFLQLRGHHIE